ncbi:MAG: PHP domain-containing protein [Solobacterium sp.]|nr:PHP domain-containing protein [Solobacterium sp.]
MIFPDSIDLHMHSTSSDGTDTPLELLKKVKDAGIGLFSLTDHDAIKGSALISSTRCNSDPAFLTGIECSCKDSNGKYHILGYGYDPSAKAIRALVEKGHAMRMEKLEKRLRFLSETFDIHFPEEEIQRLYHMDNPGKPHLGNLMVKYGYAKTKDLAIQDFLNLDHSSSAYLQPQEAITAIRSSHGIPILAHPIFGSGSQMIRGEELKQRVGRLASFGLLGLEAFYSGFSEDMIEELIELGEHFDMYLTAGSDYHGSNKTVRLGETHLEEAQELPAGMTRFLEDTASRWNS